MMQAVLGKGGERPRLAPFGCCTIVPQREPLSSSQGREVLMAYTTRTDALEFECPNCHAPVGSRCVSARGRKRESVHRERMNAAAIALGHPPTAAYTITGDRLLDADGHVVGKVHEIELFVQSETLEGNLRRGGREGEVVVDSASTSEVPTLSHGSAEGKGQTELLPDPVDETWALYVELLERPKAQLTPKVRRWIGDAHQAVGVERTRDAIRGLATSEYHRQNNYVGIEYALVPKQGQTIEGRVEMMAGKAGSGGNRQTTVDALLARLPSEAQPMVRHWMNDVQDMLRNPEHPGLKATGEARLRELRERARMEPIIEGDRIVDWRRVNA